MQQNKPKLNEAAAKAAASFFSLYFGGQRAKGLQRHGPLLALLLIRIFGGLAPFEKTRSEFSKGARPPSVLIERACTQLPS